MGITLTKRNHYNPCFWAALWNESYFNALLGGHESALCARKQSVYSLNVRSGAIHATSVENVFYDKKLGLADISTDSTKRFYLRRFPSEYAAFCKYLEEHPEPLVLDFENIFSGLDDPHVRRAFTTAARIGGFESTAHKGFVTALVVMQAMRSHEFMASTIEQAAAQGIDKWEYFWLLKSAWADPSMLSRTGTVLAMARWTLYKTREARFPLCDSPVMINPTNVMLILSPRLLAEIDLTVQAEEHECQVKEGIGASKYREFRRRTIDNTYKDIIFSDSATLEEWRSLPEFKFRMKALADKDSARAARFEGAQRIAWALYGFGRIPHDFEDWIEPVMTRVIEGQAVRGPVALRLTSLPPHR